MRAALTSAPALAIAALVVLGLLVAGTPGGVESTSGASDCSKHVQAPACAEYI